MVSIAEALGQEPNWRARRSRNDSPPRVFPNLMVQRTPQKCAGVNKKPQKAHTKTQLIISAVISYGETGLRSPYPGEHKGRWLFPKLSWKQSSGQVL